MDTKCKLAIAALSAVIVGIILYILSKSPLTETYRIGGVDISPSSFDIIKLNLSKYFSYINYKINDEVVALVDGVLMVGDSKATIK